VGTRARLFLAIIACRAGAGNRGDGMPGTCAVPLRPAAARLTFNQFKHSWGNSMSAKSLVAACLLALSAGPALAADAGATHPFNVQDLVMLKRLGDPQLSPDGSHVLFTVRRTDYAANKGITSIYDLDLSAPGAEPVQLVDKAASPRWSRDGRTVYFLSSASGSSQLWSVPAAGGKPTQVSRYPVEGNNFTLSPGCTHVAVSLDVCTHAP